MNDDRWTAVDRYLTELLVPSDAALESALAASDAGGVPAIQVTPSQGKLLQLLAEAVEASAILELGTLGGYSTIWLARALPEDGRLVTLEIDPAYADVARANLAQAGVADRVDLRVGPAADSLAALAEEDRAPFDLVFIDADKRSNPEYLSWALQLSRPGTLIVADNVIRDGAVANPHSSDPDALGVRRFFELVAADSRLTATVIQTVGEKGWDGFLLARVLA